MWAAELLKQSRGISPPTDGLVSRNPEPEGWQAASLLSAVSPASRSQMCLGPRAAGGRPVSTPAVYRGRWRGRTGRVFSRKGSVFLSRFSLCRLEKETQTKKKNT